MFPFPAGPPQNTPAEHSPARALQLVWFAMHLAAVYLAVWFLTPWASAKLHDWIVPRLGYPQQSSQFEFLFSHLFALTFLVGFLVGLLNTKHQPRAALFVWVVPALVLAYHFLTFPTSLFEDHWTTVLHYYFNSEFLIPEFHSYQELFQRVAADPDAARGLAQLGIVGPLYAGVGYSGAILAVRAVHKKKAASAGNKAGCTMPGN